MRDGLMLEMNKNILKYPYNDDIRYVEGEDLTFHNAIVPDMELTTELNCVCETLPTELAPKLIYKEIPFKKGNMEVFKSYVEYIPIFLDINLIHTFSEKGEVRINYNDGSDRKTAFKLINNTYDGVAFYGTNNTLVIPVSIYNLAVETGKPISCLCAVYNYNKCSVKYQCFDSCNDREIPELNFKYIPNTIKYAELEEEKYGTIQGKDGNTYTYLFKNIPFEYYSRCIHIDSRTLAYNFDKGYFIGHSNANQTKLNHLCYDVAKNGLKKCIQLKLLPDGSSVLYFSNKRQLVAQYLGVPSIPMVVILDNQEMPLYLSSYKPNIDCKDIANKLFNPYFLF